MDSVIAGRLSPFMGYKFRVRQPRLEEETPSSKPIRAVDILSEWYGRNNVAFADTTLIAMERDAWPSLQAGIHPDTMLQAQLRPGDLMTMKLGITGGDQVFALARDLVMAATDRWRALGLPVELDEWRGYARLKTEPVVNAIASGDRHITAVVEKHYEEITQLVALDDNVSKFTVQRYVPPCWFMQDMSANHVVVSPLLRRAGKLLHAIAKRHLASSTGKQLMEQVLAEYSDPFGTAVGWPLFKASTTLDESEGITDDAKLEVLNQFDGVFSRINWADDPQTWLNMMAAMRQRAQDDFTRAVPLAYLTNRRYRVGGKWNPDYALMRGAAYTRDLQGAPYMRIAQAASWLGNLIQGTLLPYFKALRMTLTGCYHTTELVSQYLPQLADRSKYVLESDISQYDLNFAIEVTDMIDDIISSLTPKPRLAKAILHAIRRLPIVIPNPDNIEGSRGAVVLGGEKMLPSGIKLTAEYGTLGNVLVTICGQIASGQRDSDIINYWDASINNTHAKWLMQGDDKAMIGESLPQLVRQLKSEAELYAHIGTTAKTELCDRFLQKHMFGAKLAPVMGRMFQQRLSNEHVPESPAQYLVGVTSSLIGVAPHGTDSLASLFGLKATATTPAAVRKWQVAVLEAIATQLKRAAVPQTEAIAFIEELASPHPRPEVLASRHRAASMALIEEQGLNDANAPTSALTKLLVFMDRYRYSASVADFYDSLTAQSPEWAQITKEFEGKKVAFAQAAYKVLRLPQRLFMK